MSKEYDYLIKILLVGDSGVGKTCILKQFIKEEYNSEYLCTIGVDYSTISSTVQNKFVKLQLWDTAGQERFRTITQLYYRGTNAIIMVFDITNKISFNNIKIWLDDVEKYAPDNVVKILIGNKSDIDKQRQITKEEVYAFSESNGFIKYYETSAKNNTNIDEIFFTVENYIVEKLEKNKQNQINQTKFNLNIKTNLLENKKNKISNCKCA